MFSWNRGEWVGEYPVTVRSHHGIWGTFMAVYAWFLALQILDLGSTLMVIRHGGIEANQLGPAQAVDWLGPQALLGMKLIVVVASMLAWVPTVAWLHHKQEHRSAGIVNAIITAGTVTYTLAVLWNLAVLRFLLG